MKPASVQRGFTMVELMIVVAVAAILSALAAPSFLRSMQSMTISNAVNAFLADARFARVEAFKRGGHVVMCRTIAPDHPEATCAQDAAPQGWAAGWIVFHDLDGDGTRAAGEPLLRVHAGSAAVQAIVADDPVAKLRYSARGPLLATGAAVTLEFGDTATLPVEVRRVVCVNSAGRVRIAGNGAATCGA